MLRIARCPICRERMLPTKPPVPAAPWDCPSRHQGTSNSVEYAAAQRRALIDEIQGFLRPADELTCDEHVWVLIEPSSTVTLYECVACRGWRIGSAATE